MKDKDEIKTVVVFSRFFDEYEHFDFSSLMAELKEIENDHKPGELRMSIPFSQEVGRFMYICVYKQELKTKDEIIVDLEEEINFCTKSLKEHESGVQFYKGKIDAAMEKIIHLKK